MKGPIHLILIIFLPLISYNSTKIESCRSQGIKGHVYRVSGNQMPSPDIPPSKPSAMKATLLIYELTNINQVSKSGDFYRTISTKLVESVDADEDGFFKIKLKPGTYSLFIKKEDLFYSNVFDDKFNIYPVEIKKGKWTEVDFKADFGAVY